MCVCERERERERERETEREILVVIAKVFAQILPDFRLPLGSR